MNSENIKRYCRDRFGKIMGLLKNREIKNQDKLSYRLTDEEMDLIFRELFRIQQQWCLANNQPAPEFNTWLGLDSTEAK